MLFVSCKLLNLVLIHGENNFFSGALELIDVSLTASETQSFNFGYQTLFMQ